MYIRGLQLLHRQDYVTLMNNRKDEQVCRFFFFFFSLKPFFPYCFDFVLILSTTDKIRILNWWLLEG